MTNNHYCINNHGVMVPVWNNEGELKAWLCEKCLFSEGLRPGEEKLRRGNEAREPRRD